MASGIRRLQLNKAAGKKVGRKISKIMHEGLRGKKVKRKQAIAAAYSMVRSGKY